MIGFWGRGAKRPQNRACAMGCTVRSKSFYDIYVRPRMPTASCTMYYDRFFCFFKNYDANFFFKTSKNLYSKNCPHDLSRVCSVPTQFVEFPYPRTEHRIFVVRNIMRYGYVIIYNTRHSN